MNLNLSHIEDYRKTKAGEPKISIDTTAYTYLAWVRLEVDGHTKFTVSVQYGLFFAWRLRRAKNKLLKRWAVIQEIQNDFGGKQ